MSLCALEMKRAKNRIAVQKYSAKIRRLAGTPILSHSESVDTIELFSQPVPEAGCWVWTKYRNRAGYGVITTRGVRWLAHRLSWKVHKGDIPDGMLVCHKCDTPSCVNPSHLFLGDSKDNMDDMNRKGRHVRGEKVKSSKLTEAKVLEIRSATGTQNEIAELFGISRATVGNIKARKRWSHV